MSDVTEYFSDRADDYARFRPSYPAAAVAWIAAGRTRAVDVGSGTGLFARLLAGQGLEVVGVEPSAAMRSAATSSGGGPRYVAGTAESSGLESGCCDLVTAAQAFHWFDAEPALAEFHRLLVPGGRLALVWNVRDDATPMGAVFAESVRRAKLDAEARGRILRHARSGDTSLGGHFRLLERRVFQNPQRLDWPSLWGRACSASYFPPPGALHEELRAFLQAGFAAHAIEGIVELAQETQVFLSERAAAG